MALFLAAVFLSIVPTIHSLIYVEEPKSFFEANQYCRDTYGTTLAASIISDQNKTYIRSLISTSSQQQTWVGLYSNETIGNWKFLNGDPCPNTYSLACVDFWNYHKPRNPNGEPRCIKPGRGGYKCAYMDLHGVDNSIPCDQERPFLCDGEEPETPTGRTYYLDYYPSESFEDAQDRCQSLYGTDLATILTVEDMENAAKVMKGAFTTVVRIGLERMSRSVF